MKRNFLTSGLSVLAFILAITASLAFKPAPNNAEALVPGYLQFQDPIRCLPSINLCVLGNDYNCTVSFLGITKPLYGIKSGTACYFQLSFPPE